MTTLPPAPTRHFLGRKLRLHLLWIAAALALLYALVLLAVWHQQERLLFVPSTLPQNHNFQAGADVSEHFVKVPGAALHVLQLKRPQPDGVVFFLHGNAGDLSTWFVNLDFYRRRNVDLVMMDYRGFGKSSGHIRSQQQLEDDARAVWDHFIPAYPPGVPRIVLGRSLGTGLAASLSARTGPQTTILVSPYSSIRALAGEQFAWIPSSLVRYPLRTDEVIAQVPGQLFLIHGTQDTLIAPTHTARLADIARKGGKAQVREMLIAGAAHGDLQNFADYQEAIDAAVASAKR